MTEDRPLFPVVMRGYDRTQVDGEVSRLQKQLEGARAQVAQLDERTLQISGELSEAQRQLREAERPTYSGLGTRIEQLMRSAEEQSSDVLAAIRKSAAY